MAREKRRGRRRQSDDDRTSPARVAFSFGILGAAGWFYLTQRKKADTAAGETNYMAIVREAAMTANIPPSILSGIVTAESSWSNKPNRNSDNCGVNCIASSRCAIGLAQVLPSTARDMGVTGDLCIPENNLIASARYLNRLYTKYGDWETAAIAYNWGPGNVDEWKSGKKDVYSGSVAYAEKVLKAASKYQDQGMAGTQAPISTPRVSMLRLRTAVL